MSARDPRLDAALSRTLTWCTAIAGAVCLAGLLFYYSTNPGVGPSWSTFRPDPSLSASRVLRDAGELKPLAIAQLGVVLLVVTPGVRVAMTIVLFLRQGDRFYALLAGVVLAALAAGLVGVIR